MVISALRAVVRLGHRSTMLLLQGIWQAFYSSLAASVRHEDFTFRALKRSTAERICGTVSSLGLFGLSWDQRKYER